MDNAAFFDLDRTLLRGASGPVFSTELKRAGLLPDRSIPGEGLVFKVFDVIGETIPSMLATRQMARAASGWERAKVQAAGGASAAQAAKSRAKRANRMGPQQASCSAGSSSTSSPKVARPVRSSWSRSPQTITVNAP